MNKPGICALRSLRIVLSGSGAALLFALAGCGPAREALPPTAAATPSAATASAPATPAATSAPGAAPSQTSAATPAPDGAGTQPDPATAAVQTIVDYYAAISAGDYAAAYRLWGDAGAASGQSSEQFAQGFANTAGVSILLGAPDAQPDGSVAVPIEIISVRNDPNPQNPQRVEHFRGSYQLAQAAGAWQIAGADIAVSAGPLPPAQLSDADEALRGYYGAINAQNYPAAYTFWGNNGGASQQSYAQFRQGFASTSQVQYMLGEGQANAAAGSAFVEIPIVLTATDADGSQASFCGSYRLRRANVPPFDLLGWHIDGATIAPTDTVAIDSEKARQILSGGCRS